MKSAWFEKALCGDFKVRDYRKFQNSSLFMFDDVLVKEAKSREINIQQIDPNLLDWTIKCIYHLVGDDFEESREYY